jgi:hypothetical protein
MAALEKTFPAILDEAFKAQSALSAGARYNAACATALAAAGQGEDAGKLSDRGRSRLREQALAWLRADLALWEDQVEKGEAAQRAAVQKTLRHWQQDAALAGVREAAAGERSISPDEVPVRITLPFTVACILVLIPQPAVRADDKDNAEAILRAYLADVQRRLPIKDLRELTNDIAGLKKLHELGEKHLLKNKDILHKKATAEYLQLPLWKPDGTVKLKHLLSSYNDHQGTVPKGAPRSARAFSRRRFRTGSAGSSRASSSR